LIDIDIDCVDLPVTVFFTVKREEERKSAKYTLEQRASEVSHCMGSFY